MVFRPTNLSSLCITLVLLVALSACTPASQLTPTLTPGASASPTQPEASPSTSSPVPNPVSTPPPAPTLVDGAMRLPSPGGRWTAILDRVAGSLMLEDAQGVQHPLFPVGSTVGEVKWSPQGRHLAVVLGQLPGIGDSGLSKGLPEIHLIHLERDAFSEADSVYRPEESADAITAPGQIILGAWSPDGSRLLFWSGPQSGSIQADGLPLWVLEIEGMQATPLARAALVNPAYQSWAPDGRALVFTNGGYRSAQVGKWLSLYDVASGQTNTLVAQEELVPGQVAWSPAGDSGGMVAFAAVEAGKTGMDWADWMGWDNPAILARRIYLLDPQTGEYRRLNASEAYQDAPRWSADGTKLYYIQLDGNQVVLMAADPATGDAQPLPGCKAALPDTAGYYGQLDWTALYDHCQAIGAEAQETSALIPGGNLDRDCSLVEQLTLDSPEAQQILDEFDANYKEQYPTEYMGMAILQRVDRLGEWAVIQGSVSGEAKDVIAIHQTPQGYQLAERYTITAPLESFDEPEALIPRYFIEKLPEAPQALFTCLDQTWLLAAGYENEPSGVFQLAYISTDDYTSDGVTEIHSLQSDGSNHGVLLHEPMLIMGLVSSPDGEQIAFWGCPGSLSLDCSADEDLDVWVVNWDGSNLRNLTEDSAQSDSHPDWSPDGGQMVFDSDRSGNSQIYIMNADGSSPEALTDNPGQNTVPKWSPDGNWIAYQCSQAGETRICVVSPEGQPAGEPISGSMPVWSPGSPEDGVRLAFLCFQDGQSDICTARPDGSEWANLTGSPADEHAPAWSPDGNWLAFVSNRDNDVDIYKVCLTCPGEPAVVRLTDEPRAAGWPLWSPDGTQVVYESAGDLLVGNADRSAATYLTSGVFGPPIWRP
jgi:Tol biopolymer transport system component